MSEKVMQYVGARYVPKFADPIEWQENTAYEALTVVMYNNSSYTSKIPVPANVGIPATNDKYWALTGNYNGQIEEYRQETEEVKNKQSELDTKVDQEISDRSALIYNNNGKADVSLGLSVEGKLSANDGAEISGTLKYGTINKYKDHSSIALESDSGETYHIPTVEGKDEKTLLIIGDSWTNRGKYSEGTALAKAFENYYDKVYNYGINGSTTSQIPEMCKQAYDEGVRPDLIIAICGTNDVFWGSSSADFNVDQYYKTVQKHYFPNNSKTANQGRNRTYWTILDTATKCGWHTHPESLYTLLALQAFYVGSDEYGVQHLTDDGQRIFASYLHSLLQGTQALTPSIISIDASDCTVTLDGVETEGSVLMTYNSSFNGQGILGIHLGFDEVKTGVAVITRNISSRTSGTPIWFNNDNSIGETDESSPTYVSFTTTSVVMNFKNNRWIRCFVFVPNPFE